MPAAAGGAEIGTDGDDMRIVVVGVVADMEQGFLLGLEKHFAPHSQRAIHSMFRFHSPLISIGIGIT